MIQHSGKKVVTRFPPSPTGYLHVGRARTALFNFLFARKNGGQFFFRLEDTDVERSRKEFEQDIIESLSWLSLSYDNATIWRQSERSEVYKAALKKLVDSGAAYVSKETELPAEAASEFQSRKKKEGAKRDEVIRFRNPNKSITFTDLVRGDITFNTSDLGDFVVAKSMEEPLYHFGVIVDDAEMGVTHVIRGEDGISNTPRQILMQEALGFSRPLYAHIPLILAADRSKLSGRHGAVSVREYREKGFLPEALVNYLALLGWNPGTEQEILSMDELIRMFDLAKVQKGGAVFSEEKLRSINKEYLRKAGPASILPHIPPELLAGKSEIQREAIVETIFERISTFGDIAQEIKSGAFDYLSKEPAYEKELLHWKKATDEPAAHLEKAVSLLEAVPEQAFTKTAVKEALMPYAEEKGKGNVLWPIRVALSGKEQSPDPFTLAAMLGKILVLGRINRAKSML